MNKRMKQWIILFFTLASTTFLCSTLTLAQGWEKTINTSNQDNGISVAITHDGHYVVAGHSSNGLGTAAGEGLFLTKIDDYGNQFWTQSYGRVDSEEWLSKVIATSDGGFLLAAQLQIPGKYPQIYLVKTDADGVEEWSEVYTDNGTASSRVMDVVESSDGSYIFTGYENLTTTEPIIGKVEANGNLRWIRFDYLDHGGRGNALVETPQNEIIIGGMARRNPNSPFYEFLLLKLDADGNEIWSKKDSTISFVYAVHLHENGEISTIAQRGENELRVTIRRSDADGNALWTSVVDSDVDLLSSDAVATADKGFIATGIKFGLGASQLEAFLLKIDSLGNREWCQFYGLDRSTALRTVVQGTDLGYLAVGSQSRGTPLSPSVYILKTDSAGILYSNIVSGQIAHDTSLDCVVDAGEAGFTNWIVEARKDGQQFFGSSDSSGHYEITADTGTYQLIVYPPNPYWEACAGSIPLSLNGLFDTTIVDFAIQPAIECPLLVVDVGTPFLRRCFDNVYSVNYCNEGSIAADSAYVDITLDPYLSFISSTLPSQMLDSTTYRFSVGDIDIGECGSFNFTVYLDCDSTLLGQVHCVEAHIYPDSICLPLNSGWSGAFVEVDAACQDSLLQFSIENTGSGAMGGPLRYVIIEDAILLMTASFELGIGETQEVPVNNNGSTYLIFAEQEPGAPGNSLPIATVEGCVSAPGDPFSTGFFNQFPQNDLNPFVEIDCRVNIGSYDPNDKQGFPLGYGAEHFIEDNTDIEYFIRFQNTGTDTAFTVVIRDTLSPWLDPTSVRPGASSHSYDFNLSRNGVVSFTFNNILLPDSTTNLLGSNGFVKFRISQKRDNPIDTRIENRAAIFFDFNPPVLTNTTFHTIGEDLVIIVDTQEPLATAMPVVKVYPNPMQQTARLEFTEGELRDGYFDLYNASGELVREDRFSGDAYTFERRMLSAGFYFFRIRAAGKLVATGKIMIQ